MANYYEVPLSPNPQRFVIGLVDVPYNCSVYWNQVSECWCIDIADVDQNMLVAALPIVTGVDMLAQHRHLGFGGSLVVQVAGEPYSDVAYQDLGVGALMLFVTE